MKAEKIDKKTFSGRLNLNIKRVLRNENIELSNPAEVIYNNNNFEVKLSFESSLNSENIQKIKKALKIDNELEIAETNNIIFSNTVLKDFTSEIFKIKITEFVNKEDNIYLLGTEYPLHSEEKAEKMANELVDFVNSYSCNTKVFIETLLKSHRTLQQNLMRLFMKFVIGLAENSFDARNEDAVSLAKKIKEENKNYYLPFI